MGVGCSASANMGAAIEKDLAKKLQYPIELAANIAGNIEACAT